DLKTGSVLDFYNFASHSPAPFAYPANDIYFFAYGLGNLIKRLSAGLQYVVNAPVTNIDYSANPIVITAGGKTYQARKVIVTASTGVLAADMIDFKPVLPAQYNQAIKA